MRVRFQQLTVAVIVGCLACVAAAQPLSDPAADRYRGHRVVRAELDSLRDVRTMLALSDDPWTCGWDGVSPGSVDFRVSPDAYAALAKSGISHRVLIEDVQALIDREQRAGEAPNAGVGPRAPSWFDAYQPLSAVSARVDELVAASSGRAQRVVLGSSIQDREIFAIKISSGAANGGGDKPAVVINGCQHAREWITVMASMYLAEALLSGYGTDSRITRVVDATDWYIVPIVNVDGYEHSWQPGQRLWRKNRRDNGDGTFGVDTNRNWDASWGTIGSSGATSSDTYRGVSAFSEPESRALRDLLLGRTTAGGGGGIALHVDVHSYSQLILEPVGYDWNLPADTATFARLSLVMQEAMHSVAGMAFSAGPIYRNIYPVGGGSIDWTYDTTNSLASSFELRDEGQNGFVLPADQIVPASQECVEGLLAAAAQLVDRPVDVEFVNGPPVRVPADAQAPILIRPLRGLRKPDTALPFRLFQRIGRTGPFASSDLVPAGTDEAGPILSGQLSAGPCGSVVQFYFEIPVLGGGTLTVPPAPAAPFEAPAQTTVTLLATSFESAAEASGWVASQPTDTATAGQWTRGDPNGTIAQPEFDRSPLAGAACYYTGANPRGNVNSGDVDGGRTTLLSPVLNLLQAGSPDVEISFWVWYSNNRIGATIDEDVFVVDIAPDGTASSPAWVRALTLAAEAPIAQATGVWRRYSMRAAALGAMTSTARLRFIASDVTPGSYVEAAVDDFTVTALLCAPAPCLADWNGSGAVSIQDIFDFLAAYFAGDAAADFNASGSVSVQDVFDYLAAYFVGCPI